MEDSPENARNVKYILCLFDKISGLKINFHKSEIYCPSEAATREKEYTIQ
jgi:hypothetical protein